MSVLFTNFILFYLKVLYGSKRQLGKSPILTHTTSLEWISYAFECLIVICYNHLSA